MEEIKTNRTKRNYRGIYMSALGKLHPANTKYVPAQLMSNPTVYCVDLYE